MKLYQRLILILGGASLLIFLIHAAMVLTGISGNSRVAGGAVSFMQEDFLKKHSEAVGAGNAAYLEMKFDTFFSALEYILSGKDAEKRMSESFKLLDSRAADYVFVEKNGKILCVENPDRVPGTSVIAPEEYQVFLRLIRDAVGSGKRTINLCQFVHIERTLILAQEAPLHRLLVKLHYLDIALWFVNKPAMRNKIISQQRNVSAGINNEVKRYIRDLDAG